MVQARSVYLLILRRDCYRLTAWTRQSSMMSRYVLHAFHLILLLTSVFAPHSVSFGCRFIQCIIFNKSVPSLNLIIHFNDLCSIVSLITLPCICSMCLLFWSSLSRFMVYHPQTTFVSCCVVYFAAISSSFCVSLSPRQWQGVSLFLRFLRIAASTMFIGSYYRMYMF